MGEIKIDNITYKFNKNYKEAYNEEEFINKCTDYFYSYDYIVGDYAYGKLRLKGFNKKSNPNYNNLNDYTTIEKYIKETCAFECAYFVLEKIN